MPKRHAGLIALSHDHHHTLALALRLRQGDAALLNDGWTHDTIEQARRLARYYEDELRIHFKSEEEILFPLVRTHLRDASPLIDSLTAQHREVELIVAHIGRTRGEGLAPLLVAAGTLLERHIRTEERELFPLCESEIADSVLQHAAGQMERLRMRK